MNALAAERVREFVTAGHFDLDKVKSMLAETPALLNAAYAWSETDHETAIMAATQTGNRAIAEYLIGQGAPVDIYTASMLAQREVVTEMLDRKPELIRARGVHGIPLLAFASLSGDVELVQTLVERGAVEGVSFALHNAVSRGFENIVRWLLDNAQPDLHWKNYEGKTALAVAQEQGNAILTDLLQNHGTEE
jgi:ankyrin repeat protein